MSFGYPILYANGLNSNSQIRRSADFVYQRGGTYEVHVTGTTNDSSLILAVDLYANDEKVGNMNLVPYTTYYENNVWNYKFNIRPYNYLMNYINTEHYQYYWLNDFVSTSQEINIDAPYSNGIKINIKYGYKYLLNGVYVGDNVTNDFNHYTYLPEGVNPYGFYPSGYTSTGPYFDYLGGTFQFNNNFILQNFDQEIGTIIGTGYSINTLSLYNRTSPIGQYIMDYPTVPEQSETGRFLTSAPRIQYIQDTENYVLYYLNGQSGDRQVVEASFALLEFYNGSNTLINRVYQDLRIPGSIYQSPTDFTDTLKRFAFPCGPVDIQNLYYSGVSWNDVAYYRVQLMYGLPTWNVDRLTVGPIGPVSETFYFYLYNNCLPESTRLCWLNEQGGYDYYTFQSYRQDTKKVERQSYDNRYYATNLNSPDRNVGRSTKTYDTNVTQEIVLESNYISVAQAQWLESAFISPQVYIMGNDFISPIDRQDKIYKDLQPVQVVSTDVETLTKKHKKLNKYRISIKTADSFFVNKGF